MNLPKEFCSFPTQPIAPMETLQEVASLKRGPIMMFDRKHQKNNIFVLFHPHFPRVNKLSVWPLEAGNGLAVVKDVTHLIQREPFLQVVFHRVIGPQIFTVN